MNVFQRISRNIIKVSFDTAVSTIEYFSKMERYHQQVDEMRKLGNGTLGKEIANCLDINNLTLVPHYESHDLKHVLLDYKMTPEDEIRLQAFMIGNGNYSIPSFTIFLFGAILLPELWSTFVSDFKKGRSTTAISQWSIESCATRPICELRAELAQPLRKETTLIDMKQLTQFTALATVLAGIFGMLFCLPFLFSSNLLDLVGAGFPFVGGAILVVGRLLTLSNLTKERDKSQQAMSARI